MSIIIPGTVSAAPAVGTGTGLSAKYYYTKDLTGNCISRIDSNISFNWGNGSPDRTIAGDTFSAQWTGKVQPLYSEDYTFYTTSDDGVRLWVNGVLLIDNWTGHSAIENKGTITLIAGQKYDIKLQYYESTGAAQISLSWSSKNQSKQIIPKTQLYPDATVLAGSSPFDYAVFSNYDTTFNGLFNYVAGSIHANNSFTSNGTLTVTDNVEAKYFTLNGINKFGNRIENGGNISITNVPANIADQLKSVKTSYNSSQNFHSELILFNNSISVNGDVTFDAAKLSGKGTIKAKYNIIFNGATDYKSDSDDVCFYSENGDIIVNGLCSEIHGSLYAPNGRIIFNGIAVKVYGRIIAQNINVNGNVSVYYKDCLDTLSFTGDGTSGDPQVMAVSKGADGNIINNTQNLKISMTVTKDIDKLKIKLSNPAAIKLPGSVTVKNIVSGDSFSANVSNGYIYIDDSLTPGNYEIPITVTLDKAVTDGDKITLESVTQMNSSGNEIADESFNQSITAKTLKLGLSSPDGSNITAFKGWNTTFNLNLTLNTESYINSATLALMSADTNTIKELNCNFIKVIRIEAGKEVVVPISGSLSNTKLSPGEYKIEFTVKLNESTNSKWSAYINSIKVADTSGKIINFGPFNSSVDVISINMSAPPKLH